VWDFGTSFMNMPDLEPTFPDHPLGSMCDSPIYVGAASPGEAAASLVSNKSGVESRRRFTMALEDDLEKEVAVLIDYYLSAFPGGQVVIDMHTPRGRARRGLQTKQRRLLRIRLGNTCHYVPGVVYNGEQFTVTATAVTVRCRCQTTPTVSRIRTMDVWPSA
jgi:hypothetical protein